MNYLLSLFLFLSLSIAQANANDLDALERLVEDGTISLEGKEIIESIIEDCENEDEFIQEIARKQNENGIQINGENKNGWVTAARIAWNMVRPANAHAGTHNGRGRCNSGCGRNSP